METRKKERKCRQVCKIIHIFGVLGEQEWENEAEAIFEELVIE